MWARNYEKQKRMWTGNDEGSKECGQDDKGSKDCGQEIMEEVKNVARK